MPWGRTLSEYQAMFALSKEDLDSKILGCGDGPASFNCEMTQAHKSVTSIDPIYQFSAQEIQQRIDETSALVSQQVRENQQDYRWTTIHSVDELIAMRLSAMRHFIADFDQGKKEKRYVHEELPNLSFEDKAFDLVLSSHFLFLYSEQLSFYFHKEAILEMCRVARREVRIFPLLDLKNKYSLHVKPIIEVLSEKGFKATIIKTPYEFQKGAYELLSITRK